ncbi:hypothetical protein PILCRDRAFT_828758 [Piloderma croceum F 1598]|uniref:Uncharacterized protein n=1 Tax=Piloderma croceum (strain F 1598) TaxID=765440 RepID=A0A0C3B8Z4_PILCF|nr:hypothetical protein PILCRDRAFT_828758 [Piloderma croceum F 1598]
MYGWQPMAPCLTGVWTVFLWTLGDVKSSLVHYANLFDSGVLLGWKSEMGRT